MPLRQTRSSRGKRLLGDKNCLCELPVSVSSRVLVESWYYMVDRWIFSVAFSMQPAVDVSAATRQRVRRQGISAWPHGTASEKAEVGIVSVPLIQPAR